MKTLKELREKSVSQAQQKMMGMALAYKRGELDDASPEVKKMADSMSMKDLEDFAKTKHKGLPDKVDEKMTDAQKKTAKSLIRLGDKPRQAVKTAKGEKEKDKEFYRKAYREGVELEEGARDISKITKVGYMDGSYLNVEDDDISVLLKDLQKLGYKKKSSTKSGLDTNMVYSTNGKPDIYISYDNQNDMAFASYSKSVFESTQHLTQESDSESVELDEAAPKIKGNSGPWSKSDLQKAFKAANVDVAVQARITKALREMK